MWIRLMAISFVTDLSRPLKENNLHGQTQFFFLLKALKHVLGSIKVCDVADLYHAIAFHPPPIFWLPSHAFPQTQEVTPITLSFIFFGHMCTHPSLWCSPNSVGAFLKVQCFTNVKTLYIFSYLFLLRRTHLIQINDVDLNTCLAPW